MGPRLSVKYRRRSGVPYAIEQLSGRQFRCRHCNTVYLTEREITMHLKQVAKTTSGKHIPVEARSPKLDSTIDLRLGYFYDIRDYLQRKFLKLGKNEIYDGETTTK